MLHIFVLNVAAVLLLTSLARTVEFSKQVDSGSVSLAIYVALRLQMLAW